MVCSVGNTDSAGLRYPFQTCRDVYSVTKDIVTFDEHVPQIDADAEKHLAVLWHIRVALGHKFLDRQSALDGGHD